MDEQPPPFACACCGYKTIYDEHEICPVCNWQGDWAQESRPDWAGCANGASLRQAQHNFIKTGDCEGDPNQRHMSPSLYERDPQWRPYPAQPDIGEDARAWEARLAVFREIIEEGRLERIIRHRDLH